MMPIIYSLPDIYVIYIIDGGKNLKIITLKFSKFLSSTFISKNENG